MMKIAGSESGSISQKHGSEDPDPDQPQNVMDPEHWTLKSYKNKSHELWLTWAETIRGKINNCWTINVSNLSLPHSFPPICRFCFCPQFFWLSKKVGCTNKRKDNCWKINVLNLSLPHSFCSCLLLKKAMPEEIVPHWAATLRRKIKICWTINVSNLSMPHSFPSICRLCFTHDFSGCLTKRCLKKVFHVGLQH